MPPLISLVTPTLNAARFISETLRSVSEQDYPHLEHIIVDGQSTDDTLALVGKEGKRVSEILCGKDSGTSEAINKGFERSQGEYLWVLNADDALAHPAALSVLARHLEDNPACDFAFGDMRMIDENGRTIGVRTFAPDYGLLELLSDRRHLPFAGCLMRRRVLTRIGGFSTSYKYSNDLDFLLRLTLHGRMQHVGGQTGVFRLHAAASTSANIMATGQETQAICQALLKQPGIPKTVQEKAHAIQAALHVHAAGVCFHAGVATDVRRNLKSAIAFDCRALLKPKPWIYLAGSLAGTRGMAVLARWCRAMVHKRFLYSLNNLRP